MQGLALADCLTAFCLYGFEPVFAKNYALIEDNGLNKTANRQIVDLKYPYCVMHFVFSQLSDNFHLTSVLLTTCLGLQKLVAIVVPVWSRTGMSANKSIIVCLVCFMLPLTLHIPRLFMVAFTPVENADICSISQRGVAVQEYVLSYYPMAYSVIIGSATICMVLSTCIIFKTLCLNKAKGKETPVSFTQKRSSVLVLCVLVVFLVTEVPRLYLNGNIIGTYWFQSDDKNVVWLKELKQVSRLSGDYYYIYSNNPWSRHHDNFWSLNRGIHYIPTKICSHKRDTIIGKISRDVGQIVGKRQTEIRNTIKQGLNQEYVDLFDDLLKKLQDQREKTINEVLSQATKELMKNDCWNKRILEELSLYTGQFVSCWKNLADNLDKNLTPLILVSSPFSEQLNYMVITVWKDMNMELDDFKLFLEVLKISTVIGCMSNFVIYIVLSEKLRTELSRKLLRC
ncbi:Hypothetical predicted protein [Mytilus galloprovincialis]|uniref:G-protein coupled receptors family 1 profile domain-containing protein n=1 Tax=Mytilus galloprovincialis TaxID=29158 RepID=A0A8B6EN62_MYTGA|nr:Hypothetical predicted protein [Mytilus galloprovincialis]